MRTTMAHKILKGCLVFSCADILFLKNRFKKPLKFGRKWQFLCFKVSKGPLIRKRYNQVPHLTQDTNGKVTNPPLDTTNESQEVSSFPAGDHNAHINRRTQRHSKHKAEKNIKEVTPWNGH